MGTRQNFLSNWDNVTSEGRNELVFENKNKAYGAYLIRKKYNYSLLIGVLISLSILSLTVIIPLIKSILSGAEETIKEETTEVVMELKEPAPLDKIIPIAPPPPPPPPVMEQIKFTPPEVTEEDLPDEDVPPPQEKLNETNVGTQTTEGDPNALNLDPIQESNDLTGSGEDNNVYTVVEQNAEYPGGLNALRTYIGDNYNETLSEQFSEIGGTIEVTFIVDKAGEISEVTITKGIKNKVLENEAVRVIKSIKAKWKPAKMNGKAVIQRYSVPISFGE